MTTKHIDRIHPAVSFGYFIAAIATAVIVRHPIYLAISIVCALLLNISISGKRAIKQALLCLPVALVIAVVNPLFNTLGKTVLFTVFGRPYSWEALVYGAVVGGMFLSMLLWFAAYNAVLTDDKFAYLFSTLSPSLSLLLTTVFRMIPNLTRRTKQILNARMCIGKGGGNTPKEQLRSGMTAISVLTSWALEGSVTTADSMNSRGYGTAKRTSFHNYRFTGVDGLIAAVLALSWTLTLAALLRGGDVEFIPVIQVTPAQPHGIICYLIFLLTPAILNWKEDIKWYISRSGI